MYNECFHSLNLRALYYYNNYFCNHDSSCMYNDIIIFCDKTSCLFILLENLMLIVLVGRRMQVKNNINVISNKPLICQFKSYFMKICLTSCPEDHE